jgi:hypothetical protein
VRTVVHRNSYLLGPLDPYSIEITLHSNGASPARWNPKHQLRASAPVIVLIIAAILPNANEPDPLGTAAAVKSRHHGPW